MKKYQIVLNGVSYNTEIEEWTGVHAKSIAVTSPVAGKVSEICTSVGSFVNQGDLLLVVGTVNDECDIIAPTSGTVAELRVSGGSEIQVNMPLVIMR